MNLVEKSWKINRSYREISGNQGNLSGNLGNQGEENLWDNPWELHRRETFRYLVPS